MSASFRFQSARLGALALALLTVWSSPALARDAHPRPESAPASSRTDQVHQVRYADAVPARMLRSTAALSAPAKAWTRSRFTIRLNLPARTRPAPGKRRPVRLQIARGDRWSTLSTRRIGRAGTWTPVVRAGATVGKRRYRVLAPRTAAGPRWTSRTVTVGVVARPASAIVDPPVTSTTDPTDPTDPGFDAAEATSAVGARGSITDWTWTDPVNQPTWADCQVIRWAYDPTASYGDSLREVKRSFARVSGISGLRFRYVGDPRTLTASDYDIRVGWSAASGFEAGVIGLTMFRYTIGGTVSRIKSATISFNSALSLTIGIEPPPGSMSTGQLFEHEIMHAVGMGHAAGTSQLMYPMLSTQNPTFGAGDRMGLATVGTLTPC